MKRIVLTLLVLTTLNAQAATYYVATNGNDTNPGTQSQPFKTIQKGIDTAVNGDTMRVGNGTYKGAGNKNLDFGGKNFTLKSLGGAANCIIDCEQNGRGFTFHNGETAQAVVDGFTISNGRSTGSYEPGGGMLCQSSSPTVCNCIFSGNYANGWGGAVSNDSSNPIVINCTFSGNTAFLYGGGMANLPNSSPTVTNCTFNGNSADVAGGMHNDGNSNPTVTNCTFSGNRVDTYGGGMVNYQSNPTVTDCTFTGNYANWGGGGMNNSGSSQPIVTTCRFIGNSTSRGGGGMANDTGSNPLVTACSFSGNVATRWGGGMYNWDTNATVTNCIFQGNRANQDGGGISNTGNNTMVANCLFTGNRTNDGGGMSNYGSDLTVTNCTFAGNSASDGGGMFNATDSTSTVTNCILWGDAGGEITGTPATLTYTNVQGLAATPEAPDSEHNFGADPRFIRNPSPGADNQWATGDDDYGDLRLRVNSPCINAGTAAVAGLPAYDMQGVVRIQGSTPDMGAYEFGFTPYIAADLYVDRAAGSDITGNGTPAAPFQTVNKALSMLSAPIGFTVIHVKAGNYGSDRPRVTPRVRFINWGNTGKARIGKP